MRCLVFLFAVLFTAAPAAAQIQSRPTDPPIVTAENDSWYQLGEPVSFAGDQYFRAGATTFFNGNTMVRTGHYNGVPLYADTTIEPYSIVYVPIGRGLMQPYERVRGGSLAGTSGSRPSSFPGVRAPGGAMIPNAPVAPTAPPQPIGAINAFTPEAGAVGTSGRVAATPNRAAPQPREVVGTGGVIVEPRRQTPMVTVRRGDSNRGISVSYQGLKWVSAGPIEPLIASEFIITGAYAGFPVYSRKNSTDATIYLPATPNQVTPFRLAR
jgi:hypothetical protein